MSAFFRKFLQEEAKGAPRAFLAAFGKHPGWNDHIDDLGLDTETLVLAKRMIYLEGLSSQIDAGAWEKLDGDSQLEGFNHTFLWQRGNGFLLGSMVSSRDGKGRTRYPMVLCAQFDRVPLTRVLYELRPQVEAALDECRGTNSAEEVRRILDRTRQRLQATIGGSLTSPGISAPPSETLSGQLELGPDDEGLLRVLYQIKSQLALWAPGRVTIKMHQEHAVLSACLRVPQVFSDVSLGLHVWSYFMATQLDPLAARLFVWPRSGRWLDILIGEPVGADFFGLRATTKALPCANDVPYEMDADFRARARGIIGSVAPGSSEPRSIFAETTATRGRLEAATDVVEKMKASAAPLKPTRHGLIIGVLVAAAIAALALLALLLSEPADGSGTSSSAPTSPSPRTVPAAAAPQNGAEPRTARTGPADNGVPSVTPAAQIVAPVDADAAWSRLCHDYYEWLGALQAALRNSERRARWESDPDLGRDVVGALTQARKDARELDPRAVAGVQGDLLGLAATPPAVLSDPVVREKVLAAAATVAGVGRGIQQWPRLARVRESRATLAGFGWTVPVDDPSVPEAIPLDDNLVATVDKVLATEDTLTPVAQQAVGVMAGFDTIEAAGDPQLAAIRDALLRRVLAATSVGGLGRELQQVQKTLEPVLAVLASEWSSGGIARDRLAAERHVAASVDENPAAAVDSWLQNVRSFAVVAPDSLPLPASEFRPAVERVEELVQQLAMLTSEAEVAPLRERLAAVVFDWSAIRAGVVVQKDLPEVAASARKISASVGELAASVSSEVARRSDPAAWLQQVHAIVIEGPPAVREAWARRRDAVLEGWDPASASGDVRAFVEFQGRIDRLAAVFRSIAAAEPLSASVAGEGDDLGPFSAQLDTVAAAWRAGRQAELVDLVPFKDGVPAVSGERFWQLPAVEAVVNDHRASLDGLRQLGTELLGMSRTLAAGAPWQDVSRGHADWSSRFDKLRVDLGNGVVGTVVSEMVQLERIAASSDPRMLATMAADPDWTRAITAWTRLGQVEAWPGGVGDLDTEARLETDLRSRAGLEVTDAGARDQLAARWQSEGRARWLRALPRLDTDADLARAYAAMSTFGVAESDLPAAHRYNLVLIQLRGQTWSGLEGRAGATARDGAVRALSRVPGLEKSASAPIVELLRAVSFGDETVDFSRQGPGLQGWKLEKTSTPAHVVYSWQGPEGRAYRLDFLLVSAAGEGTYLAATEMPVQLFLDWVDYRSQWPAILDAHRILLEDFEAGDPRRGPRSYGFEKGNGAGKGARFTPPGFHWLAPAINRYAEGEAPSPPSGATPLNYVSFDAATLFAGSIGCRLPAEAEWRVAQSSAPAGTANVRDERWLRQLQFQKTLRDSCWPDSDIFVPGSRIAAVAVGANATAAITQDDGFLWFSEVPSEPAAVFSALVGNVAEYVVASDGRVGVIGGSALSPPEIPVGDFLLVDKWDATRGFADVGFRLAFSVGKLSGAAEVQRILQTAPFLR